MSEQFRYLANDDEPDQKKSKKDGDVLTESPIHLFKGRSTKAWSWKGPGMAPDCEGKTLQLRS
ncbi:hypothetical protein JNK62_02930 [bacterium]|nr:hypothetical protein [bacterium]